MGIIHWILVLLLRPIIGAIAFPYTIVKLLFTGKGKELIEWYHHLAYSMDLFGNYLITEVGTDAMLKEKKRRKYGQSVETISRVTADNYYNNNLTWFGKIVARIMIFFKDKSFNRYG